MLHDVSYSSYRDPTLHRHQPSGTLAIRPDIPCAQPVESRPRHVKHSCCASSLRKLSCMSDHAESQRDARGGCSDLSEDMVV